MVSEKIRARVAEIQLREDSIIYINILPSAEIFLDDANEFYDAVMKLSRGDIYPLLIDVKSIVSMERSARKRFSNETVVSAVALIVETPLSRIIGNFFVGLNKTAIPLRLFSSEADALNWLKEFNK